MMLKFIKWVTILVCLVAVGIVIEGFVLGADVMKEQYGVDPRVATGLMIFAEIVFDATVVGLAFGAGHQIRWKEVFNFEFTSFREVRVQGFFMNLMIVLNAVGWLAPFFYFLVVGYSRMPGLISLAMATEIILHLLLCAYVKGWVKI